MNNFLFLNYIDLISFERSYFLLLALQPLVIMLFRRLKMHSLSKYSDKRLWPWSINVSEQHFRSRHFLRMVAWLLIAIAMSGPRLPGFNDVSSKHDKNMKSDISIMIVADVNGIKKSEQNTYLIKMTDFIDNLQGEKIGFVGLTTSSALISPLTNDYNVSSFYLKQMFDIIDFKIKKKSVGIYKSLSTSYKEIKKSNASTGIIIYWSDYSRNTPQSTELIKTKILIEEMEGEDIKIFPIWTNAGEINSDSVDVIFGDLADDFAGLTAYDLYEDYIADLKSNVIFDKTKDYGYQQLYSKPLVLGLLLLILSFIPIQFFRMVRE